MDRRGFITAAIAAPFASYASPAEASDKPGTAPVPEPHPEITEYSIGQDWRPQYVYVHECGEPAFYFPRMPVAGALVRSEDVILPDGSQPVSGSAIVCGTCGKYLGNPRLENIHVFADARP